jgi:apolipoprotein N-acyltransferase
MPPPRDAALPRVRWAALVAVLAGLAAAAAFPRLNFWPLIFASVAGLSWAVDGRRSRTGAWLGLLYGAAFFGALLHWTGTYVGAVPWLLLAGAEAAVMAGLGAVLPLVQRLPLAPAWIGAAWVLEEAVRDRAPFGGFPWGRLAFSQADSPLRWFAAIGGQPLLSFAVAVLGATLAVAARSVRPLDRRALLACAAVLVALPLLGGVRAWIGNDGGSSAPLRIALIQGSVPDRGLGFEDRARQVLDNHVRQTMRLAAAVRTGTAAQPDLVLWPENASDVDPFADRAARAEIDAAVRAVRAPVLVGAILQGPGPNHRRNAGILWSPTTGPGAVYLKRHPVPFAEYMPLRSLAEKVSSAAKLVTQDMVGGHGNGLLRGGPVPLGDVICFEVAYDDLVRSSVAAGAQLLVIQTNNATFGHTAETYQQLAMSRLRAVETGRATLQVSTTGVSAVIGPDGGVQAEAARLFSPAVLTATVPARTAQTLATRLGAVPEYVLAGLAVLAAAGSVLQARRRRRGTAEGVPAESEPSGMVVG